MIVGASKQPAAVNSQSQPNISTDGPARSCTLMTSRAPSPDPCATNREIRNAARALLPWQQRPCMASNMRRAIASLLQPRVTAQSSLRLATYTASPSVPFLFQAKKEKTARVGLPHGGRHSRCLRVAGRRRHRVRPGLRLTKQLYGVLFADDLTLHATAMGENTPLAIRADAGLSCRKPTFVWKRVFNSGPQ